MDDTKRSASTVLARVPEKYAAQLAKAVLLSPRHIAEYVKYSIIAIGDPHSDYAPQMARVCRRAHQLFMRGLNQLSESDKEFVARQVIEPATCKALALPEAD